MYVTSEGVSVAAILAARSHEPISAPAAASGQAAAKTYTDQAVHAAQSPASGSDSAVLADQAIVAIAAELRLSYQANPNNEQATDAAEQAIVARYGNSSEVKQWSSAALKTVLTETPAERATNEDLAKVDQAGSKLSELQSEQASGKDVSNAQIAAAQQSYQSLQQQLLVDSENELTALRGTMVSQCHLGTPGQEAAAKEAALEPNAVVAMTADHVADPELTSAIQAAAICQNVTSAQGLDAQIAALGKGVPAGLDPTVKSMVLADPAIKAIMASYVSNAAQQIAEANQQVGPLDCADTLQSIIVQQLEPMISSPELLSQLTAQILNASMPTINSMLSEVPAIEVEVPNGPMSRFTENFAPDSAAHVQIALDLSQVVDVAAASGNSSTGVYDTPQITDAINGVARAIATNPQAKLQPGLTAAVGQGYATLALATALQTQQLTPGSMSAGSGALTSDTAFDGWKKTTVSNMLADINTGIGQFETDVNNTFASVAASAPQLSAQGAFGPDMPDATFNDGVSAMTNGLPKSSSGPAVAAVPGLKKTLQQGMNSIAALGYRLIATSDAVSFYEHTTLGQNPAYAKIDTSTDTLMTSANSISAELWSPAARQKVVVQQLRQALASGAGAQYFSLGAQTVGDLVEFLAETYYGNSAGQTPGALVLQDDAGNQLILNAERVGHTPFAAAWALGGGLQGLLTDWVVQNSHPGGPLPDMRKVLTVMIVGGFGTLHVSQSALAVLRNAAANGWLGSGLGGTDPVSGKDTVKSGTLLDSATRLTVEPTLGLIQALTTLMGLATLSDAAGLVYDATGLQPFAGGTAQQATNSGFVAANFVSDLMLLRLQARGWGQQLLGQAVFADPAASSAFSTAFNYAMLDALGQPNLVPQGVEVSPVLLSAAQQFLAKNSGVQGVNKIRASFQSVTGLTRWARGGQFGRDAFLRRNALTSEQYLNGLSGTARNALAANWAVEDGSAAQELSPTLAYWAKSRVLNLFVNVANKLHPKNWLPGQQASAGSGGDDGATLAAALEENALGDSADVAADATVEAASWTNPIGWFVNAVYFSTTVGSTFFNQYENVKASKQAEYAFLRGAGVDDAHASALSAHGFFSNAAASSGLVSTYAQLGGNPADFVHYINSMPIATLDNALAGLDPVKNAPSLPATAQGDYWTLPVDPNVAAQRKFNPNLTYNLATKTWEDKSLGMSYLDGVWVKGDPTSIAQAGEYYDPASHTLITSNNVPAPQLRYFAPDSGVQVLPKSLAGVDTWLLGAGVPPPPATPSATPPAAPAKPAKPAPVTQSDTVTVKPWGPGNADFDTLRGIAGNNEQTLLSVAEQKNSQTDDWTNPVKTAAALRDLVALNPGFHFNLNLLGTGLSTGLPGDPNTILPGWILDVYNPNS
jgi:hypothetical protein